MFIISCDPSYAPLKQIQSSWLHLIGQDIEAGEMGLSRLKHLLSTWVMKSKPGFTKPLPVTSYTSSILAIRVIFPPITPAVKVQSGRSRAITSDAGEGIYHSNQTRHNRRGLRKREPSLTPPTPPDILKNEVRTPLHLLQAWSRANWSPSPDAREAGPVAYHLLEVLGNRL